MLKKNKSENGDVIRAALDLYQTMDGLSVEALVQACLDQAEFLTHSRIGFLHFVNDDEDTIDLVSWSTRTRSQCYTPGKPERHYPVSRAGVWVDCIRERKPVIHNDYASLPHKKGLPEGHVPLIREAVVPVFDEHKIVAIIGVGNKETPYTEEDIHILGLLAKNMWVAIERKRAEDALRESQRRLSMATQSAGIGFHEVDLEKNLIYWDEISYRIHGYDPDEPISLERYRNDILHPDDLKLMYPLYQKALESGAGQWKGTFRIIRPDGQMRWIDEYHLIIRDGEGKAIRTLGAKTDVTKRKKNDEELARYRLSLEDLVEQKTVQLRETEQQLVQSQKLEAIGQLAGGLAHDLNNLFSIILGFGESVLDEIGPQAPHHDDLVQIMDAGNRAANLTRQLLAFSRKQTLQPKTVDLNRILSDMEKMLRRLIGEDIELTTLFTDTLWPVRVDPGQMEQVIMNLVINARDAMPDGGKLTLETANAVIDCNYADHHVSVQPGEYAMVTVTDTGQGMDQETRERIFDPFFTTKERGKGTGLGLSTVYGIVKQSEGNIWVYSEPGLGTTFKLYFPRMAGPLSAAEKDIRTAGTGKGEMVLVVEDEVSLHILIERMLKKLGYRCFVTADTDEALARVSRGDLRPDLLITDVVMPKINGKVLAERMAVLMPKLRVLFMSGYTDNTIVRHGVLDEGFNFIQKPFSTRELAEKIQDVLSKID